MVSVANMKNSAILVSLCATSLPYPGNKACDDISQPGAVDSRGVPIFDQNFAPMGGTWAQTRGGGVTSTSSTARVNIQANLPSNAQGFFAIADGGTLESFEGALAGCNGRMLNQFGISNPISFDFIPHPALGTIFRL